MTDITEHHQGHAPDVRLVLAATAWIAGVITTLGTQFIAQAGWDGRGSAYSWADYNISDLSNTSCGEWGANDRYVCSPLNALVSGGFVAFGALLVVGVVASWAVWNGRGWPGRGAAALLVVAGIGSALVGFYPADVNGDGHYVGAALVIALGNAAMLASYPVWQALGRRATAIASLVLGGAGVLGTVLFTTELWGALGMGGTERLAVWPLDAWCVLAGVALLRTRVDARQ